MPHDENSKTHKFLKGTAIIATALSALTGAALGINSLYDTFRAKGGYDEHKKILKEHEQEIDKNREEIRDLYKTLLSATLTKSTRTIKRESSKPPNSLGRQSTKPQTKTAPKIKIGIQRKIKDLQKIKKHQYKNWKDLIQKKK